MKRFEWKLNTSNQGKFEEFQRIFGNYKITLNATHHDLPEIDSDSLSVIAHKASQLEDFTLVEDTSLEVEGATVGVNVRWLLDNLSDYEGKKAEWKVLLAYKEMDNIYIYQGAIQGTIVRSEGSEGFGFDPVFLPTGAQCTLAQNKPDGVNARAKAVKALVKGDKCQIVKAIYKWDGAWQKH